MRLIATFTDPFDGVMVAKNDYYYDVRRAASGFYSKHIRRCQAALRSIQSNILEGRTPKVSIKFVPAKL